MTEAETGKIGIMAPDSSIRKKRDFPPPAEEKLQSSQQWLRRTFPDDFVAFLQRHNGYYPQNPHIITDERKVLLRFLPVLSTTQSEEHLEEIERSYQLSATASIIDERLFVGDEEAFTYVPIAQLEFGDLLCLDFSQAGPPAIAIWNQDESRDCQAVATRIADNFTQFLTQNGLGSLLSS